MLEFYASAYFLGILIMTAACIFFLWIFFPSWYIGRPRRFWLARLTYDDDKEQQSIVRVMWLVAWIFAIIGSLVTAFNLKSVPHTFWWILLQTLYHILWIWLMAKAIIALCILVQHIGYVIIRLKQWIFNDKPLFPKYQKLKPLEH